MPVSATKRAVVSVSSVVAYIITEGKVDEAAAKKAVEEVKAAAGAVRDE